MELKKQQITKHLKVAHSLSLPEYRRLFPNAESLCKASRNRIANDKLTKNPMDNPDNIEKIKQTRKKNWNSWPSKIMKGFNTGTRLIPNNSWTHMKSGFKSDLGHYVRSSWESNFARILNYCGVPYVYEKEIVKVGNHI